MQLSSYFIPLIELSCLGCREPAIQVLLHHHHHHDHHHHHLALQPFVCFCLLSQVSPTSSVLSYFIPGFYFSFLKSSMTSSCHRCLGLPTGLVPMGFQSNSFLAGLAWSILLYVSTFRNFVH
jgi:hypothetical protein